MASSPFASPPTWYYPADGWTVINGSEANNLRGVQWWAYRWEGTKLKVKAYYPVDFGTGIDVGAEPAHAFLTFDVTSPVEWKAWSNVNLQRAWGSKVAIWIAIWTLMASSRNTPPRAGNHATETYARPANTMGSIKMMVPEPSSSRAKML